MAEYPSWPAGVPLFGLNTTTYTLAAKVIRTAMDRGPAKVRRSSTVEPNVYSGTLRLSGYQLDLFRTWFRDVLSDGVSRFSFPDFMSGTTKLARFIVEGGIQFTRTDLDEWEASMQVEVFT